MSELSVDHKVLYVNPRKEIREILGNLLRLKSWTFGVRKINNNLFLIESPWVFPKIYKLKYLDAIIDWSYHRFIDWVGSIVGKGCVKILYVWEPAFSSVVRHYRNYKYIYHPYDLFEKYTFIQPGKEMRDTQAAGTNGKDPGLTGENTLVQNAFLFYSVSNLLCDHYEKEFGRRPKLLPNGVQDIFFRVDDVGLQREAGKILEKFPSKKIGFSGSIMGSLDLDVVIHSAGSLEDHAFLFFGIIRQTNIKKYDDKLKALFSLKNVFHLGSFRLEILPYLLRKMDALMMIYSNDPSIWTYYSGPAKLYEYMAIGKPILSTPHPAVRPYEKYISIVENSRQLISAIKNIEKGVDDGLLNEMVQIAKENTWKEKEKVILGDIRRGLARP
jgi:glycosyltransferase involved in cell wall biosynthesis